MQKVKALLVFCEGPHDVAFVRLVMKHFFGFERVEWKFSEYPAPFNQLFRTCVEKHAAQDMSLDMTHKFFLPDRVLLKEDQVALLFNTGGKTHTNKVKELLTDFLPLFDQAAVFSADSSQVVHEARYLFLYDADELGVENVRKHIQADFAEIDGSPWLHGEWITDSANQFSASRDDKAIYIWGEKYEYGTLEDILLPLYEQSRPQEVEKAVSAIDDIFKWDVDSGKIKTAVAERAKRKKSIITFVGQREKPGGSMNVIFDQAKLINNDHFKADLKVKSFATFLGQFACY